jgi:hypothetical protein
LNWSLDTSWMSVSGGVGAQPIHCGLVRQTTQPGLNSLSGTQIQPSAAMVLRTHMT